MLYQINMMSHAKLLQHASRFGTALILLALLAGGVGMESCKSKKKLAAQEAEAARARKIAKAKADLEALLSADNTMSLDEKERQLQTIVDMQIDDPEIQELITQVEDKLRRDREALEAQRRAEQLAKERKERMREETRTDRMNLEDYFGQIASASNMASANSLINEALDLFASEQVPVLVIIHRSGDTVDYDRPTTIRKYLEYLKDQKVNRNAVENVVYNSDGKIIELELIKK
jgi:hypothetical protein